MLGALVLVHLGIVSHPLVDQRAVPVVPRYVFLHLKLRPICTTTDLADMLLWSIGQVKDFHVESERLHVFEGLTTVLADVWGMLVPDVRLYGLFGPAHVLA